jgi:hypothetical protein
MVLTFALTMNRSAGLRPGANLRSATNAPGRETGAPIAVQGFDARIVRKNLTPALPNVFSAKGAASYQPGATPQECAPHFH